MIHVLRLQARRDRLQLTVWVVVLVLLVVVTTRAVPAEYGDAASRTNVFRVALATPSLLALRGNPYGASLGSTVWFQLFAYLAATIGVMNVMLATRHGRADEERGRRELLAATRIRRTDPIVATLLLGVGANVVLGVLIAAVLVASGLPVSGGPIAAGAFVGVGLAFLGIGLLVGELAPTGRSANGIGVTIALLAYVLRGAGDALGTPDLARIRLESAWPTWASPIGWGEETFAFTADRPAPLLLLLALFAVSAGGAIAIRRRRDLGASLLHERPGRATAAPLLRGPEGLLGRLTWPAIAAWTVGSALLALLLGPLTEAVGHVLDSDPAAMELMRTLGRTTVDSGLFTAIVMTMVGALAAASALQTVLRLREEEASGQAEALLSTPLSRVRWLVAAVLAGWVASALPIAAAALTGWGGLLAYGHEADAAHAVAQAFVELPAALVFAGVAALLAAALPRPAIAVGWAIYAVALMLSLFGALLKLPDWLQHASPFVNVPAAPVTDWLSTIVLTAVAVGLSALAAAAFRSRDLVT